MCHMYYKFLTSEMLESINKNRPHPEKESERGRCAFEVLF